MTNLGPLNIKIEICKLTIFTVFKKDWNFYVRNGLVHWLCFFSSVLIHIHCILSLLLLLFYQILRSLYWIIFVKCRFVFFCTFQILNNFLIRLSNLTYYLLCSLLWILNYVILSSIFLISWSIQLDFISPICAHLDNLCRF